MLLTAFILGLLGSLHCIGMCGPIAFMLPVNHKKPLIKAVQIGSYHFGRVFAYALIGLLLGLLGKGFDLFGLQQHISIAIGVWMILFVLFPHKWAGRFSISQPLYKFVSRIKSAMGEAF